MSDRPKMSRTATTRAEMIEYLVHHDKSEPPKPHVSNRAWLETLTTFDIEDYYQLIRQEVLSR